MRHQLLHTGSSITTDTDKNNKQLRTGNSITDTKVVVFHWVFLKYAPLNGGSGQQQFSCESDEYADFDVFSTPPYNARGNMHCSSC